MSQVPADLDQTMWEIAERGDTNAASEFSERFPELAAGMAARMDMVSGMKNMRNALAPSYVPPFKPKYMYKPKPIWVRYGPMALGLAALASISFYITQNMLTPLPSPSTLGPHIQAPQSTNPPVTLMPDTSNPDEGGPVPFNGPTDTDRPYRHVTMANVTLQEAVKALAKQGNLKAELPPDFPNPMVKIDITGKPGLDLLQRLGQKQGFKAIPDGDGQVILIPASKEQNDKTDEGAVKGNG